MGCKMVIVPPHTQADWPQRIRVAVPDCAVHLFDSARAGLDVYEIEPLPATHPLWTLPGALLSPHSAGDGPSLQESRPASLRKNYRRCNKGRPLFTVVDKAHWF